jgi:hypothetical protein
VVPLFSTAGVGAGVAAGSAGAEVLGVDDGVVLEDEPRLSVL